MILYLSHNLCLSEQNYKHKKQTTKFERDEGCNSFGERGTRRTDSWFLCSNVLHNASDRLYGVVSVCLSLTFSSHAFLTFLLRMKRVNKHFYCDKTVLHIKQTLAHPTSIVQMSYIWLLLPESFIITASDRAVPVQYTYTVLRLITHYRLTHRHSVQTLILITALIIQLNTMDALIFK